MALQKQEHEALTVSEVATRYSLNPDLLKRVVYFKIKGVNNADIAKKLEVHRVTVQRYVEATRKMTPEETACVVEEVLKTIKEQSEGE